MRRNTKIFIIAIILEIFGAILPLGIAVWISWSQALAQEHKELNAHINRMLIKTDGLLASSRNIFSKLQNNKSVVPCSPQHIDEMLMQRVTTNVELITYFENGIEKCNSNGMPTKPLIRQKADFSVQGDLQVILNSKPFSDLPVTLLGIRGSGNYDVYMKSSDLTDLVLASNEELAIVYHNIIISSKNDPDPNFVINFIKNHLQNFNMLTSDNKTNLLETSFDKSKTFITDEYLIAVNQLGNFFFVAIEPISYLYHEFKHHLIILIPFALVIDILIIWFIIYYSRQQLSLRGDILEAIKNHEFSVYYQPIIDTANNKCIGAEGLIRWQRYDGKMMPPDLFIPIAEEMGAIPKLTDEVINIIFSEMEEFLVQNPSHHISINVASSDIQNGRIVEVLDKKFETSKLARDQIWIELTERTLINPHSAKMTLQKLHEKGHTILIDDFGTGYSSLSYLQALTVDILKIDKAFIDSIGMEYVTSNVVNAIIEMARKLNFKLIAEGVERKAQYDFLKDNKVDYIQGYIFSKPIPKDEFIKFCSLYM